MPQPGKPPRRRRPGRTRAALPPEVPVRVPDQAAAPASPQPEVTPEEREQAEEIRRMIEAAYT